MFSAALCGSAFADEDEIMKFLWEIIKGAFEDSVLPIVDSHFTIMWTLILFYFSPDLLLKIQAEMFEEMMKGKTMKCQTL